jgi:hypothetical protein
LIVSSGLLFCFAAEAAEKVADLVGLKGRVEALDVAGRLRVLQQGAEIFEKDTLVTGHDGRARIRFLEGGNEVIVGARSRLFVESASVNPSRARTTLYLESGEVRSHVKRKYSGKNGEVFEVRTPNTIAGVRGTVFQVSYRNASTLVATVEGRVAVQAGGSAPALVSAGQFTLTVKGMLQNVRPIERDPVIKKQLQNFERSAPRAVETSGPAPSAKDAALSSSANRQARSLSQQFGFPVESTLNFVKTDSVTEGDKQRAIRNLGGDSPLGLDQVKAPSTAMPVSVPTIVPVSGRVKAPEAPVVVPRPSLGVGTPQAGSNLIQ